MKTNALLFSFLLLFFFGAAQDKAEKWNPFFAGIAVSSVPVNHISGTDTGYINALSLSPYFSIRSRKGWGIHYSPKIVSGATSNGIYLHQLTAGVEQYDQSLFDYALEYSHFFFTGRTSVPYSPLNNELYGSLVYKKMWLRPSISAGVGLGTDTTGGASKASHDVGVSVGVYHLLAWQSNKIAYSITPGILMNMATNQYFSFLNTTKYAAHSTQLASTIGAARRAARGRGNGGSGGSGGTTTTTTTQVAEKLAVSNFEIDLESAFEKEHLSIRPTGSLYIPAGNTSGNNLFGYWQIVLDYHF